MVGITPIEIKRVSLGMSRKELVTKSGVCMATISRLERYGCTDQKVNRSTAELLARALGCEVTDIFRREDMCDSGRPPMTGTPTKKGVTEHANVCRSCNMSTNPHVEECIHCGASSSSAA